MVINCLGTRSQTCLIYYNFLKVKSILEFASKNHILVIITEEKNQISSVMVRKIFVIEL